MSKLTLFLSYLAVFLYSLFFWERPIYDPDLGWHLAGGKWISQQLILSWEQNNFSSASLIPAFDFINFRQNYWHDYHWLIQIIMFQIYKNYGYLELICFYSVIFTLTCLILFKVALKIGKERGLPIYLPLLAIFASCYLLKDVSSVRPQLISFLLITYTTYLLIQSPRKPEGIMLFLMATILVNIHIYWVFIPFLYFCYRLLPALLNFKSDDQVTNSILVMIFISLAGFISPYGIFTNGHSFQDYFQNYYLILDYLKTDSFLKVFITEFLSGIRGWSLTTIIALVYLTSIIRFLNKQNLKAALGIHLAGAISLYLLFDSVKFSSIFAIFALISWIKIIPLQNYRPDSRLLALILIFLNVTLGIGVLNRLQTREKIAEDIAFYTPTEACSKLTTLKLQPQKYQILTDFTDGGWCYWAIFNQGVTNFQITTDGRTQGALIEDYRKSYQMYAVKEDWNKTILEWNPDFILASRENSLAHVLPFFINDWQNIYIDRRYALYTKTQH